MLMGVFTLECNWFNFQALLEVQLNAAEVQYHQRLEKLIPTTTAFIINQLILHVEKSYYLAFS